MITTTLSRLAEAQPNVTCDPVANSGGFFNLPHWYKYLSGVTDGTGGCIPKIQGINDVWLIVAAIIDILLRLAVMAAIVMIIYGGIQYITSQGEPDKSKKARSTIFDALIGLGLAVAATAAVTFVAGRFKG